MVWASVSSLENSHRGVFSRVLDGQVDSGARFALMRKGGAVCAPSKRELTAGIWTAGCTIYDD